MDTETVNDSANHYSSPLPDSVEATLNLLEQGNYVAGRNLATMVYLALKLKRPLFLEGEAGVGKTELAKVLSASLGRRMIRLQCYEGLDLASSAYEWNYPRQMIEIRLAEATGHSDDRASLVSDIFSKEFLIERPLLQALKPAPEGPPILLIDELDRTDEPFEAFLLELLSDFQISIPELGNIKASEPPIVILTSNRTREIHDALKRRCLYHWVDYPDMEREQKILASRAPGVPASLSREIVCFVHALRDANLFKSPGIAETIDWAEALVQLDMISLDSSAIDDTLGVLLKYQDDIAKIEGSEATRLLQKIKRDVATAQ
ncbi:AAA family ATPase [Fodinicurvata sediminis]|uniref:AAA family ATPase n=1 Tax=Fodinicurvata sediminis TaxID=1121832 RepID=UPI0003B453E3|nr:MoxR family ATPase [Fodinicurvata sediminis]